MSSFMNIDIIRQELANLETDRDNITNAINALTSQLEDSQNKLLAINGAIRTCEYFLSLEDKQEEINESGETDEEK